jgi:hypothetical protein
LRSATEAVAPTADFICVVSAVSRDTISPDWAVSKKAATGAVTMREDVAAHVGDDTLAERDDEEIAARRGRREDGGGQGGERAQDPALMPERIGQQGLQRFQRLAGARPSAGAGA